MPFVSRCRAIRLLVDNHPRNNNSNSRHRKVHHRWACLPKECIRVPVEIHHPMDLRRHHLGRKI